MFCFLIILTFLRLFHELLNNTKHVCTYINAFLMAIPNKDITFENCNIFDFVCEILDLSCASVVSV